MSSPHSDNPWAYPKRLPTGSVENVKLLRKRARTLLKSHDYVRWIGGKHLGWNEEKQCWEKLTKVSDAAYEAHLAINELADMLELSFNQIKENKVIVSSTNKSYRAKLVECGKIRRGNGKTLEEMISIAKGNGKKQCTVCKEIKPFFDFIFYKGRNYYYPDCRACMAKEKYDQYQDPAYKKQLRDYQLQWRNNLPEEQKLKRAEKQRKYREENIDLIREKSKAYRATDKYKQKKRKYVKEQRKNPQFVIRKNLSKYVREGLQKFLLTKTDCSSTTMQYLGCEMPDFLKYLESRFHSGMTWENYEHSGWHLDHIVPLSSFDLTKKEERDEAFHHTNYQPLWANKEAWEKHGSVLPEPLEYNLTKSDFVEKDGELVKGSQIRKEKQDGELL